MPEKKGSIKNTIGNFDECGTIYDESLNKNSNFITRALGYPLIGINWLLYLRKKDLNNAGDKNIKKMIRSQKISKLAAKTGNKFGLVQYGNSLIKWRYNNSDFYDKFKKNGGEIGTPNENCKGLRKLLKTESFIFNLFLYYHYIEKNVDLAIFYLKLGVKKNDINCINGLSFNLLFGIGEKKNNYKSLQLCNYIKNKNSMFYFHYGNRLIYLLLKNKNDNIKIIKKINPELKNIKKILDEIKKHTTLTKKSKIPFKSSNTETNYWLLMSYYQCKSKILNETVESKKYQKCFTELHNQYKKIFPENTILWWKADQIVYCYFLYYGLGIKNEEEKKANKQKAKKILELSKENPDYDKGQNMLLFEDYENLESTKYKSIIITLKKAIQNLTNIIQKDMLIKD